MRIATIGSGFIVKEFVNHAREIEGVEFVASYSRSLERGREFADSLNIENVYTDLDLMFNDPEIDFIYIASPNSLHYEQAKMALLSGKNVIVEKPFSGNEMRASELLRIAKEKDLMIFEAISNIHLPNFKVIKENLDQVGRIRLVQCNFSQYSSKYQALLDGETPNVFNPEFSGGALADINIYNLHFVVALFGMPKDVDYVANIHANGIDTSGIVTMIYDDFVVECVGAKDSYSESFGIIQGEKGYIKVEGTVSKMDIVNIFVGEEKVTINQNELSRLAYEVETFKEIFERKDFLACQRLGEHTVNVVKVAEKARRKINMFFDL